MRWFKRKAKRDQSEVLFLTHTPHGWLVGQEHNGRTITAIEPIAPTRLFNGGQAPCYEVRGRMPCAQ